MLLIASKGLTENDTVVLSYPNLFLHYLNKLKIDTLICHLNINRLLSDDVTMTLPEATFQFLNRWYICRHIKVIHNSGRRGGERLFKPKITAINKSYICLNKNRRVWISVWGYFILEFAIFCNFLPNQPIMLPNVLLFFKVTACNWKTSLTAFMFLICVRCCRKTNY